MARDDAFMRRLGIMALVLVLQLCAACAEATSEAPQVEDEHPQRKACEALAEATCARLAACFREHADVEDCREREVPICVSLYGLPGISPDPNGTRALADAIGETRCRDIMPIRYTLSSGTLSDGRSCARDEQCKSGMCDYRLPVGCPICYSEPAIEDALGHACGVADAWYHCPRGTRCSEGGRSASSACVLNAHAGEPCTDFECSYAESLECRDGRCVKVTELGETCTSEDDCRRPWSCDAERRTCQAMPDAPREGNPCGGYPNSKGTCAVGEYCDQPIADASGICARSKMLGEPCAKDRECASGKCSADQGCVTKTLEHPPASCDDETIYPRHPT